MTHLTNIYCGLWGIPGCQFSDGFEAFRVIVGSFALACLSLWAFGLVRGRG
jgi:hypothetical protein